MKTTKQVLCRRIASCILAAFIAAGSSLDVMGQAVRSDYEIQRGFKEEYKAISDSIELVESLKEAKMLFERVKRLEDGYKSHDNLLNKVLHPDTFKGRLTDLKRRTITIQRRMATIEYQENKLIRLNDRLAFYGDQLDRLNTRSDSLREAIRQSVNSEKELSGLVRQYRESLEKRDDLILSFVDSIMVAYDQMDFQSVENLEKVRQQLRVDAGGNALAMVEGIVRENIAFLKSNPKISTEEYLRMNAVQQQFEKMWNSLGGKITSIYAEKSDEAREQMNKAIEEWDEQISQKTWASLNRAVSETGIDLPEFNNSQEFYNVLNGFLDNSISSSKEKATEEGYKRYKQFNAFWTNQIKAEWSAFLDQGDVLSNRQMASIDQKLDDWAVNAVPESNNILVYLLGASVLALVVLGVMLAREKNYNRS